MVQASEIGKKLEDLDIKGRSALAVFIIYEKAKGKRRHFQAKSNRFIGAKSKWSGYLETLPKAEELLTPMFWSLEELKELEGML